MTAPRVWGLETGPLGVTGSGGWSPHNGVRVLLREAQSPMVPFSLRGHGGKAQQGARKGVQHTLTLSTSIRASSPQNCENRLGHSTRRSAGGVWRPQPLWTEAASNLSFIFATTWGKAPARLPRGDEDVEVRGR